MAHFEDLLPLVRRRVAGCPDFVVIDELRSACREFCQDSRFVKRAIDVTLVSGQSHYDLEPSDFALTDADEEPRDSTEIIGIHSAQRENGCPLYPAAPDEVNQQSGFPSLFVSYPPATIEFVGTPDDGSDGAVIRVWCAAQPTRTSLWFFDDLAREFDQALADGAIARIASWEGAAWSSPRLAAIHGQLFHTAKMNAKGKALRAQMPRGLRVQPVRF